MARLNVFPNRSVCRHPGRREFYDHKSAATQLPMGAGAQGFPRRGVFRGGRGSGRRGDAAGADRAGRGRWEKADANLVHRLASRRDGEAGDHQAGKSDDRAGDGGGGKSCCHQQRRL